MFEESVQIDILKHLHNQQHKLLQYRRSREYQVFTWTTTILLGITAGILAGSLPSHEVVDWRFLVALAVAGLVIFSISWQLHQRRCASSHARAITQIAGRLGAFDKKILRVEGPECMSLDLTESLYPSEWENWGNEFNKLQQLLTSTSKVLATALLGIVAEFSIWLSFS